LINKIDAKLAGKIIRELGLSPGSSFTNTEPTELCYEYRVETGFYLPEGKSELVELVDTKDEEGGIITSARVEVDFESLGLEYDEEDILEYNSLEDVKKAHTTLCDIAELVGDGMNVEITEISSSLLALMPKFNHNDKAKDLGQ
jgi:hypothetical protein